MVTSVSPTLKATLPLSSTPELFTAKPAIPAAIAITNFFNVSGSEHFKDFDWLEEKYSNK